MNLIGHPLRRTPFALLAASLALCLCSVASSAADQTAKPAPKPSEAPVNPITQAAVKAGVLSCAGRVNQVTNFLAGGREDLGVLLLLPESQRDRKLFSSSLEIGGGDAPVAYASASFAPNQVNGCGALYETVFYRPDNCSKVAAREFKDLKQDANLGKHTLVLSAGFASRIFLMPVAGKGCVVIKKELVLN